MIRFHNRVVDTLPASVPPGLRFLKARAKVTRHYQWMLRTDYLPRICAAGVVSNVFTSGRKAFEVGVPATDVPTMPIEFSVAAFRLGHSTIRRAYDWNNIFDNGFGTLELLFTFSAGSGTLGGGRDFRAADRGFPASLRLQRSRAGGPRRPRGEVQPSDAHRHDADEPVGEPPDSRTARTTSRSATSPGPTW